MAFSLHDANPFRGTNIQWFRLSEAVSDLRARCGGSIGCFGWGMSVTYCSRQFFA